MLRVNLTGVFLCTRAALPALLAAPAGRIVNIASTAGLTGYPYVAAYCAAKHGVVGLTRALAAELAATRVTVNAVCPGYTDTDIVAEAVANIVAKTGRSEDAARAALAARNPQGRLVAPDEVAAVGRVARARRGAGDHRAGAAGGRRRSHGGVSRRWASDEPTMSERLDTLRPTDVAPDPESRLADDDHDSLRLWLRLLTCTLMIEKRIRSQLREQFATTLPRFDLMAQLERHPDGLRMGELSQRLMVTGGNVTGLVDQLVAEGLVTRAATSRDRRALVVQAHRARQGDLRSDGRRARALDRRNAGRPARRRARAPARAAGRPQARADRRLNGDLR